MCQLDDYLWPLPDRDRRAKWLLGGLPVRGESGPWQPLPWQRGPYVFAVAFTERGVDVWYDVAQLWRSYYPEHQVRLCPRATRDGELGLLRATGILVVCDPPPEFVRSCNPALSGGL